MHNNTKNCDYKTLLLISRTYIQRCLFQRLLIVYNNNITRNCDYYILLFFHILENISLEDNTTTGTVGDYKIFFS